MNITGKLFIVVLYMLIPIKVASGQEGLNVDLSEERNRLLEENNINLEDVVSIDYGVLETKPHLEAFLGDIATHTTQAPIIFTFKDGSEKVVMDFVTFTLEYQDVDEQMLSTEAIYLVDCTATYSSSWYGTAKSKTIFERDTTAHKVRTYSSWISLFDHTGYWPWSTYGGLYYIEGGPYGSWLDQFTTHHSVYWKLIIWPYSMHIEELSYSMSWAACVVH